MSIAEDARQTAAGAAWCMIEDSRTVESRFGLRDCSPTDAGGNRCAFVAPAWARDPQGRPRVGALAVLADHILGELPYMRRPPRTWSLTAELSLDVIGDLPSTDVLFAEAVDVTGGPDAFLQCRITTAAGRLVAVGTARTAYVAATGEDPVADAAAAPSAVHDDFDASAMLGLQHHDLTDGVEIALLDPGNWVNGFGILHGGVSACVSELAAAEAVRARNPTLSTAHVHTSYLRPVVADAPFVATARLHHVGRSSAVVEVLGRGGRGELCAVATVTATSRLQPATK
ncbi:hotdog fold thioesterase [Mycobacteriaceae bacterium Msp059]|nr:hotdog fold thioesterase [Mycobacteriaceae bacterium Msp059]